jgi:hypothetical protein
MRKEFVPIIICAADLGHLSETRDELSACGELRCVPATAAALAEAMPDADAYYASLEVVLTAGLINCAPRAAGHCHAVDRARSHRSRGSCALRH